MVKKSTKKPAQKLSASELVLANRRKLNRVQVLFDATLRDELRVVARARGMKLIDLMADICRKYIKQWESGLTDHLTKEALRRVRGDLSLTSDVSPMDFSTNLLIAELQEQKKLSMQKESKKGKKRAHSGRR